MESALSSILLNVSQLPSLQYFTLSTLDHCADLTKTGFARATVGKVRRQNDNSFAFDSVIIDIDDNSFSSITLTCCVLFIFYEQKTG